MGGFGTYTLLITFYDQARRIWSIQVRKPALLLVSGIEWNGTGVQLALLLRSERKLDRNNKYNANNKQIITSEEENSIFQICNFISRSRGESRK